MSIYKNYFDKVNCESELSAQCAKVTAKAAKIKARRRRAVTCAAGMTAAFMITTTAAASAYNMSIGDILKKWFRSGTETVADNLSEVTVLKLEENNFGALELTPKGMVTDDNVIVIFMDVTRTDGGVFDSAEYEIADKEGDPLLSGNGGTYKETPLYRFNVGAAKANVAWTANVENEVYHHKWDYDMEVRQYEVDDGDPRDNKITMAFCFDKTSTSDLFEAGKDERAGITDMRIEDLRLRLGNLRCTKYTGEKNNGGGILLNSYEADDLPLIWDAEMAYTAAPVDNITVKPGTGTYVKVTDDGGIKQYDRSFTVKSISVSKISLSIDLEAPPYDFRNYTLYYDMADIIMKNGDVLKITKEPSLITDIHMLDRHITYTDENGVSTNLEHFSIVLKDPIDPADVKSVRVGNTVFDINP